MEKRFLVIATLVLVATFFASYTTDPTGEAIRANRLNYQPIEDTDSGTSLLSAQGNTQGQDQNPQAKQRCACEVDYPKTNNCPQLSLAQCVGLQGNGGCTKIIRIPAPSTRQGYIEREMEFNCQVMNGVKCGCVDTAEAKKKIAKMDKYKIPGYHINNVVLSKNECTVGSDTCGGVCKFGVIVMDNLAPHRTTTYEESLPCEEHQ